MAVVLAAARDPERVREAAREVFERAEFNDPAGDLWDVVRFVVTDPVGAFLYGLQWLLSRLPEGTAGSVIAWVAAVVAAVAVVLIVVRFARTVGRDDAIAVPQAALISDVSARDLDAESDRLEAAGEWRAAIRSRYNAVIAALAEAGIVDRRPGRTTGEYLRQVARNAPHAAVAFGAATELFEAVWYGDADPGPADAAQFRNLSRDARSQAVS